MIDWVISDQDIESAEQLLLPRDAHFPDDARTVIRCWKTTDVAACPGSGKTTVLLAKLKLLADRMPFDNGSGICVLSHTNVAVDEIKKRLSGYAEKLLGYPNYIGTIQSFVDRFVTMPYLRKYSKQNVQTVDNRTYAQRMLKRIQSNRKYSALYYLTKNRFVPGGQFPEPIDHIQALRLYNGALYVGKQRGPLAGADTASTTQYKTLIYDLLKDEGIIRFQDAYSYAEKAIKELPKSYTDLFSARFQFVFIDEFQDCDQAQREAITAMFNPEKCSIIRIGDPDQAIYNSVENDTTDWTPNDGFLQIKSSCRYSQEIANVICSLKKNKTRIATTVGETKIKPIILLFDMENIDKVLSAFINVLEQYKLYDCKGVYKAIGAVRNENSTGLKIGSYWSEFDGSERIQGEYSYWALITEVCKALSAGRLYRAEQGVRKLICRVFHYLKIKHPCTGKDFTIVSLKEHLEKEYHALYRQKIYEMAQSIAFDMQTVEYLFRQMVNDLLKIKNPQVEDFFTLLPDYFIDEAVTATRAKIDERNVFIDSIRGRKVIFNTIHGVKGETHDATLYLETDRRGASDLSRILPYYGTGKAGNSHLFESSRKLAYVGFSRPKTLLCVAMKRETYNKSDGVFDNDWEIIDINSLKEV